MLTGVLRVCSYCLTRRDLARMREVADSLQCTDRDACAERAAQSGVYPMGQDELEHGLAIHEARQGALPRAIPEAAGPSAPSAAAARGITPDEVLT